MLTSPKTLSGLEDLFIFIIYPHSLICKGRHPTHPYIRQSQPYWSIKERKKKKTRNHRIKLMLYYYQVNVTLLPVAHNDLSQLC